MFGARFFWVGEGGRGTRQREGIGMGAVFWMALFLNSLMEGVGGGRGGI